MARRTITAAIIGATALSIGLAGCVAPENETPQEAEAYIGHIHGLGADASRGETYVATHTGVWLLPTDELPTTYPARSTGTPAEPTQIAERWQDTMGFTVARAGLLLGSGHPDLVEQPDLDPPNLGLIESTDSALTWDTVSLRGEVDFHDLETAELPTGELRIFGYDATEGHIKVSSDTGRTWSIGATLDLRDLAVDPAHPDRVYATTAEGLAVSNDAGVSFLPVSGAPALFLLTIAPDTGQFIGIDTDGSIQTSSDGATWEQQGRTEGSPAALAYVGGEDPWILLADGRGVSASNDFGQSVTELISLRPE